jgi:hypothetical protein
MSWSLSADIICKVIPCKIRSKACLCNSRFLHKLFPSIVLVKTPRFEVLMAVSMKMAILWVVAPCSVVEINRCFRCACCTHHQGNYSPDDGGSKHLWNVSKLLPDYMVQQPGRQRLHSEDMFTDLLLRTFGLNFISHSTANTTVKQE